MTKWYRVIDPLNPLCGCDVFGDEGSNEGGNCLDVRGLRRVDVFVGDRPYQLVAPPGPRGLGISITNDAFNWDGVLVDSPIQNEVIELVTDRPHGKCVEEYQLDRSDGVALRVARFERAVQVALDNDSVLVTSRTYTGNDREDSYQAISDMFHDGLDVDELMAAMVGAC